MKEDGEGGRRRRRLEDIENKAIVETDVGELDLLYQEYMTEAKRQEKSDGPMREAPTSSTSSALYREVQSSEAQRDMEPSVNVRSEWRSDRPMERDMKM